MTTIVRYHRHDEGNELHKTYTVELDVEQVRDTLAKLKSNGAVVVDGHDFQNVEDLLVFFSIPYSPDITINQMDGKFSIKLHTPPFHIGVV